MPARTRNSVLLPLPLGPSNPSFVPGVSITSSPENRGREKTGSAPVSLLVRNDFAMPAATSSFRVGRPVAAKSMPAAPAGELR